MNVLSFFVVHILDGQTGGQTFYTHLTFANLGPETIIVIISVIIVSHYGIHDSHTLVHSLMQLALAWERNTPVAPKTNGCFAG